MDGQTPVKASSPGPHHPPLVGARFGAAPGLTGPDGWMRWSSVVFRHLFEEPCAIVLFGSGSQSSGRKGGGPRPSRQVRYMGSSGPLPCGQCDLGLPPQPPSSCCGPALILVSAAKTLAPPFVERLFAEARRPHTAGGHFSVGGLAVPSAQAVVEFTSPRELPFYGRLCAMPGL